MQDIINVQLTLSLEDAAFILIFRTHVVIYEEQPIKMKCLNLCICVYMCECVSTYLYHLSIYLAIIYHLSLSIYILDIDKTPFLALHKTHLSLVAKVENMTDGEFSFQNFIKFISIVLTSRLGVNLNVLIQNYKLNI